MSVIYMANGRIILDRSLQTLIIDTSTKTHFFRIKKVNGVHVCASGCCCCSSKLFAFDRTCVFMGITTLLMSYVGHMGKEFLPGTLYVYL